MKPLKPPKKEPGRHINHPYLQYNSLKSKPNLSESLQDNGIYPYMIESNLFTKPIIDEYFSKINKNRKKMNMINKKMFVENKNLLNLQHIDKEIRRTISDDKKIEIQEHREKTISNKFDIAFTHLIKKCGDDINKIYGYNSFTNMVIENKYDMIFLLEDNHIKGFLISQLDECDTYINTQSINLICADRGYGPVLHLLTFQTPIYIIFVKII
jgi:hypothetical protein